MYILIILGCVVFMIVALVLAERELGKLQERNKFSEREREVLDQAIEMLSQPAPRDSDSLIRLLRKLQDSENGSDSSSMPQAHGSNDSGSPTPE